MQSLTRRVRDATVETPQQLSVGYHLRQTCVIIFSVQMATDAVINNPMIPEKIRGAVKILQEKEIAVQYTRTE